MCIIDIDDTYYVKENVENAYYCVPIIEDRHWDDLASWMGLVEIPMGPEDPLTADPYPYKEFCDVLNEKTDDADLNDWLELQEQAKVHNRQTKELVASHMEVCPGRSQQWQVRPTVSKGSGTEASRQFIFGGWET